MLLNVSKAIDKTNDNSLNVLRFWLKQDCQVVKVFIKLSTNDSLRSLGYERKNADRTLVFQLYL